MDTNPVQDYIDANEQNYLNDLAAWLSIPSVSTESRYAADVRRAAEFAAADFHRMGMPRVEIWQTPGHPAVFAEWNDAPGQPTALVYGHYDVQPVDPLDLWASPPFDPTIRDGYVYARGAADDKGQVHTHMMAARAHLAVSGGLPINLKFIVEGEEEIGSLHLDDLIRTKRDDLAADFVVISDTSMFARGIPSITYALRGLAYWQVEVAGPSMDLHSGVYGGAVANPLEVLAHLIAALKDERGRVQVPDFYDRVREISPEERAELARLPSDEEALRAELGVPALWGEEGYSSLERRWVRPTLEVNGMWGGFTGEGSKTVLPSGAAAKLSSRLVPDQDPVEIGDRLEAYLRQICPPTVALSFTRLSNAPPALTPLDSPAVRAAARALERAFGNPPVYTREGGTIPVVATFKDLLGASSVLVGFGLPDDHLHAPNERLLLANYFGGVRTSAILFEQLRS